MAELDWSILRTNQPVDIAGNFARGYQLASTIMDKMHERNALAALAKTPNDPSALATLYQTNPQLGEYFSKRGQQMQVEQRRAAIGQQYAAGDTHGAQAAALGAGELDLAKQIGEMDDATAKKSHDNWQAAGSLAYTMRGMKTPEERTAYWQQNRPMLESQGVSKDILDKIDPTNIAQLDGIISQAQTVTERIAAAKPQIVATPEGGGVAGYFPQTGEVRTLVAPNPGGQAFGAPVSGSPAPAPAPAVHSTSMADRPPPPDMHSVAALGASFGTVTSTTRSPQHNREVGGVANSYHLTGHAIDIVPKPGVTLDQVVQGYEQQGYHVLEHLNEGDHLHIAVSGGAAPSNSADAIRAAAEKAIAHGADPAQVKARAAAQGVQL